MIQAIMGLARRALAAPALLGPRPHTASGAGGPGEPLDDDDGGDPSRGRFARMLGQVASGPPAASAPRRDARTVPDEDRPPRRQDDAWVPVDAPGWSPSGPPMSAPPSPPPGAVSPQQKASAALQELWPLLVRRVAWEGDGAAASMRLELGAGALAGATLLLRCEQGRLHVALSDVNGAHLDAWRARIGARLQAAGLDVESVE